MIAAAKPLRPKPRNLNRLAAPVTLYTPEVLALATRLAHFPIDDALPLHGTARSQTCGSAISLAIALDAGSCISAIGLRSHACAIGQAAAAIFAQAAIGLNRSDIEAALDQIASWLGGGRGLPDWPGLCALGAAREYPARHGAIMLAWKAAADALPTA